MPRTRTKQATTRATPASGAAASTFGSKLRQARMDQGLTLRDLSASSNVSIAYLSDLERGVLVNPTLDTLTAIAKALGVSLNELLGVEDESGRSVSYPKALEEFRDLTPFREVIADEAKRRSRDEEELEDEWLRTLAAIQVGGRKPKNPSDYLFIFEAIRRAVERR